MRRVQSQPRAQPHILSVRRSASRLLPCVTESEDGEREGTGERQADWDWWRSVLVWDSGTDLCDSHL